MAFSQIDQEHVVVGTAAHEVESTFDKTFAERCGFQFAWAADYFR